MRMEMVQEKEDGSGQRGRMRRRWTSRRRRMGRTSMDKEAAYTEEDGGKRRKHHTRRIDSAHETSYSNYHKMKKSK